MLFCLKNKQIQIRLSTYWSFFNQIKLDTNMNSTQSNKFNRPTFEIWNKQMCSSEISWNIRPPPTLGVRPKTWPRRRCEPLVAVQWLARPSWLTSWLAEVSNSSSQAILFPSFFCFSFGFSFVFEEKLLGCVILLCSIQIFFGMPHIFLLDSFGSKFFHKIWWFSFAWNFFKEKQIIFIELHNHKLFFKYWITCEFF